MPAAPHILVAEDEPDVRANLVELLENEGFVVSSVEDGVACVNAALSDPPDLILCDILMPRMDGYEVVRRLRAEDLTVDIPLIFLTARASRADQRLGMDAGADDYVTKPFTADELINAVRARLKRLEQQRVRTTEALDRLSGALGRNALSEALSHASGLCGFSELLYSYGASLGRSSILQISSEIQESAVRLSSLLEDFAIRACVESRSLEFLELVAEQEKSTSLKEEVLSLRRFTVQWGRVADLDLESLAGELPIAPLVARKLLEAATEAALLATLPGLRISLSSTNSHGGASIHWSWDPAHAAHLDSALTTAQAKLQYARRIAALVSATFDVNLPAGAITCHIP